MKKKVLFIDRDGTIILEPEDEQIDSIEKLDFYPGAIVALHQIAAEMDFELVMVTNQDGLGTASFPEDTFWPAHNLMLEVLESQGITFEAIHIDRSFPKDNNPGRKPGTGMLTAYMKGDYDLENSFVIGDRVSDVQLATNLGSKSIHIAEEGDPEATFASTDWKAIVQFLSQQKARRASVVRDTNETRIQIDLNLDGTGRSSCETGIGFFDHMLDQLAKHSGCDLNLKVEGDLHVDEHHTIEDTAIALGQAFDQALGDKLGLARYGFTLPMDDVLAQTAIDFGGRPWLVWDAAFKREKIGEMPTEMFYHFFKSFADHAKCNLNIKAEGDNEHHKIEAIFKSLAKTIKMALRQEGRVLPSTKGTL